MSQALDAIKENFSNIITVVEEYENYLKPYKADLSIKNKAIDKANIEQASLLYLYNERCVELRSILKYLEDIIGSVRGKLWIKLTEDNRKLLQQKDKEHYINADPEYLSIKELYGIVEELYGKYDAAVDAFRGRGYVLNNLTRLIIEQAKDNTL